MKLTKGATYTGTATFTLRGKRLYREVVFVSPRDQETIAFVRDSTAPDQDRAFTAHHLGSVPQLFLAGSIKISV